MSETQYDAFNVQNVLDGREAIFDGRGKPIDYVNHPPHYSRLSPEPIDVIESWDLGHHEATALAYIARARFKGHEQQDLEKAVWYLNRRIAQLKETP